MRVIVIVPTYNESENIRRITETVRALGYDILIVDDGSPDGTGKMADGLSSADSGIMVLHRDKTSGLGPAYAAGFDHALEMGYEILCEMDADFSHDPGDLPRLVGAVEAGADLAIGSRYVPGGSTQGWPWCETPQPDSGLSGIRQSARSIRSPANPLATDSRLR